MTNSLKCHGTAQHCNESSLPSWLEASKLRLPEANPRRSPPGRLAKDRGHIGHCCRAQTQREEQLRLPTANQGPAPSDHPNTLAATPRDEGQPTPCYRCPATSLDAAAPISSRRPRVSSKIHSAKSRTCPPHAHGRRA